MSALHRISPPVNFHHAGNLPPWAWRDPRNSDFDPDAVHIDLRKCKFIWPSAVVWCACYALLVRSRDRECVLIVPDDVGVAAYLKSTGLFEILKEVGVDVDDRQIGQTTTSQTIVPLSRYSTDYEADQLINLALEKLVSFGFPGPQLAPMISEAFGELASNAARHSDSPIGGLGMIQFFEFKEGYRFTITVGDGGIGIREGLWKNPDLRDRIHYDWTAIELAARERISGTGEPPTR